MEISLAEIIKMFLTGLVAFAFGRISRKSDDSMDAKVRLAVHAEKIQKLEERVTIIERNEKTQWKLIDKIGGGKCQQT